MAPANSESTTPVEGERSGPVSLAEALDRHLPHCDGNPDKVAARLDVQHREGDVFLLGGGVAIPSGSNPSMLGIVAHTPLAGPPFLYVQMRAGRPPGPVWDVGMTLEDLAKHHQFWTFDRASFEAHLPASARRREPPPVQSEPRGWQAVSVLSWLRRSYSPDGKTPRAKTYKALQADMVRDPDIIAEIERTGRAVPSEDVIGKVVKYLGRSD